MILFDCRLAQYPIVLMALALAPACGGRTAPGDEAVPISPSPADAGSSGSAIPELVAGGIASPCNVVAAAGRVFWTTSKNPEEVWGCDTADCAGSRIRFTDRAYRGLMAVDESHLYWTGHRGSCPLTGCTSTEQAPYSGSIARGLAVDESRIFWTNEFGFPHACPKTDWTWACAADTLALEHATAVAVDGKSIYWIRDGASGAIVKLPKTGGTPEDLASLQNQPSGLFIHGGTVYWTTHWAAGSILQCPKSGCGGAPTIILTGLQKPDSLLVDDDQLYWTLTPSAFETEEKDEIYACSRDDCAGTRRMLASTRSLPFCKQRLAQDDSYVYWAVDPNTGKLPAANGSIMRIRK